MSSKTLIIGGCGYVGSSLYEFLIGKNMQVSTVDIEWYGNKTKSNNINIDFRHLSKGFLRRYDTIILLAAHAGIKVCQNDAVGAFKNNVSNFFELLDKIENQKFIYGSSSSVYGISSGICKETDLSYKPISIYDATKKHADNYAELSGKNYYGLRFGSVNGISPNFRNDIMINAMVASSIKSGLINLYNKDIKRPILYINDLNRAIYEIMVQKDNPGLYNLASFNSTAGKIATDVSSIVKVPVVNNGVTEMIYDFSIDSSKFEKTYKFKFEGNVELITKEVSSLYGKVYKSNRNTTISYI
jgi:nucleoside-diphosphate-sugar epimerase